MASISIVIPVYQVENFLKRCVDSVLNQTFEDFDVILVDDGSKDRSGIICNKYAEEDSRISVIHQENKGLSGARNAGIEWSLSNSNSSWITFIDSDDWVHPRYLESLYNGVVNDQTEVSAGIAFWTKGKDFEAASDFGSKKWTVKDYFLNPSVNAIVAWAKLFKKDVFKTIRYPEGKIHEDEFTVYKILFLYQSISVINSPIYAYYQNENGIMQKKWTPARLNALEAQEEQFHFFLNMHDNELARNVYIIYLYNNSKHQKNIRECMVLTDSEKKKMLHELRKKQRELLFQYHKYHWVPYRSCEENKQVYTDAFSSIRVGRSAWHSVKHVLEKSKNIKLLTESVKRSRNKYKLVARYKEAIADCSVILLQTPLHGNIGDHAIAKAEADMLQKLKLPCVDFPWTEGIEKQCARATSKKTLVLQHGGGNLGQLWPYEEKRFRNTLLSYKNNRIIVFPQTVYFDLNTEEGMRCFKESKAIYESHPDLTIFLRENYSFQFMRKHMPAVHVQLVPDMVMLLNFQEKSLKRNGALICLRSDKEQIISEEERSDVVQIVRQVFGQVKITDMIIDGMIFPGDRSKTVEDKLIEFASSEIVITDRLHGMIFAAITETPCIVLNSLSHKVRGCYEWLQDLNYILLCSTISELSLLIEKLKMVTPKYNYEKIEAAMKPLFIALQNGVDG